MRSPATTAAAACRAARDKSRGDRLGVVQRPATRNEPRGGCLALLKTFHATAATARLRGRKASPRAGRSGWRVVAVFHGADVAVGGSTFTAVLGVAFGAAALRFVAGLGTGAGSNPRARRSSPSATGASSRLRRHLRDPSARVAAAAGIGTHLPGLVYLAALNAIVSERPGPADAALQVATYDALWFLVPLATLALVVVRPNAALAYLDGATAYVRGHEHPILVCGRSLSGLPRRQGHGEPAGRNDGDGDSSRRAERRSVWPAARSASRLRSSTASWCHPRG